jgi:hypothetical protein
VKAAGNGRKKKGIAGGQEKRPSVKRGNTGRQREEQT